MCQSGQKYYMYVIQILIVFFWNVSFKNVMPSDWINLAQKPTRTHTTLSHISHISCPWGHPLWRVECCQAARPSVTPGAAFSTSLALTSHTHLLFHTHFIFSNLTYSPTSKRSHFLSLSHTQTHSRHLGWGQLAEGGIRQMHCLNATRPQGTGPRPQLF